MGHPTKNEFFSLVSAATTDGSGYAQFTYAFNSSAQNKEALTAQINRIVVQGTVTSGDGSATLSYALLDGNFGSVDATGKPTTSGKALNGDTSVLVKQDNDAITGAVQIAAQYAIKTEVFTDLVIPAGMLYTWKTGVIPVIQLDVFMNNASTVRAYMDFAEWLQ